MAQPTPELIQAFCCFVLNLVSADAKFVEPALVSLTRRSFTHSSPEVREAAVNLVPQLLRMYPAASEVAGVVFKDKFPHHVRATHELSNYIGCLLSVFEKCDSSILREAIIHSVIEKFVALQASVPANIYAKEDEPEFDSPTRVVTFDLPEESKFCPEVLKMDALMNEMFEFIDRVRTPLGENFPEIVIEPLLTAFDRFVAPVYGGRFVPYILMHGLASSDASIVERVVNRLSVLFFDTTMSQDVRLFYLSFAAALVVRVPSLTPYFVFSWLKRVCQWLNHQVQLNPEVGSNHIFSVATSYVVSVIIGRSGALSENDGLAQLRITRVLAVARLPARLRKAFCTVAARIGGVDMRSVAVASRSNGKRRRYVEYLLQPAELPLMKEAMKSYPCPLVIEAEKEEDSGERIKAPVSFPTPMLLSSS